MKRLPEKPTAEPVKELRNLFSKHIKVQGNINKLETKTKNKQETQYEQQKAQEVT